MEPTNPNPKLDQEFLSQYIESLATPGQPGVNILTATTEQMLAAGDVVVKAIIRAMFPLLTDPQRQLMVGQLTAADRELLLMAIQVMAGDPDLCREAQFGPEVFQDILDKGVEVENLVGGLQDLHLSLESAEDKQNGALLVMTSTVMEDAQRTQDALDPVQNRQEYDRLAGFFKAARTKQAEIAALLAPGAQTADPQNPRSLKGLQELRQQALADAGVREAVQAIKTAAQRTQQAGLPHALGPSLPPAGGPTAKP